MTYTRYILLRAQIRSGIKSINPLDVLQSVIAPLSCSCRCLGSSYIHRRLVLARVSVGANFRRLLLGAPTMATYCLPCTAIGLEPEPHEQSVKRAVSACTYTNKGRESRSTNQPVGNDTAFPLLATAPIPSATT